MRVGGVWGNAPMYPISKAHNELWDTVTCTNGIIFTLAPTRHETIGRTRTHTANRYKGYKPVTKTSEFFTDDILKTSPEMAEPGQGN